MIKKSTIIIIIAGILLLALLISSINAYELRCLRYGDSIPYYTCYHDLCPVCLDSKGYSTIFSRCNKMKPCSGGTPSNDTIPPNLTVYSPNDNQVFSSTKVLFNLTSNEPASISYLDNINGRGKWSRLSGGSVEKYSKHISFRDGFYDITIRAIDRHDNYVDFKRKFYVDSKKPKVDRPKNSGNEVMNFKFDEANPVSVALKYGNSEKGFNSYDIGLENCEKGLNGRYFCQVSVSKEQYNSMLSIYDGEMIETWISVTDIAGNIGESKKTKLNVDLTYPIVNNLDTMVFVLGKYVVFNVSVTEKNLKDISYMDNSLNKPMWKKLCASLKNGMCIKKLNFRRGSHDLIIRVSDKSGNYVESSVVVDIL